MFLEPGAQVDRYTLISPLGEGGQAQVWRAIDPLAPGRSFAIKLLWLDAASPIEIERARREAHHLARLTHPTLPTCHALFEDLRRNLLGLVLDLVEGTPLDRALADPRFALAMVLPVARRLAEGLAYLHAEGLVHRDVKPDNMLLADDFWQNPGAPGNVKLIDLGISVARGNPRPLTAIGRLIGTPPFMPPEQIDPTFWHAPEDTPAADVFALGVVVWWMLHRAHPAGPGLHEPLPAFARAYRAVAQQHLPWPPEAPAPWGPFFQKSLALVRDLRASSAAELLPLLGVSGRGGTLALPGAPAPASPSGTSGYPPPLGLAPGPVPTGPAQSLHLGGPPTGPAQSLHLGGPSPAGSAQPPHPGASPPAAPPTGPAQSLLPLGASPSSRPPPALPRSEIPRTVDDQEPHATFLDTPPDHAVPGTAAMARDPSVPPPSAPLAPPAETTGATSIAPQAPRSQQRRILLLGVLIGAVVTALLGWFLRPARRRPIRHPNR